MVRQNLPAQLKLLLHGLLCGVRVHVIVLKVNFLPSAALSNEGLVHFIQLFAVDVSGDGCAVW